MLPAAFAAGSRGKQISAKKFPPAAFAAGALGQGVHPHFAGPWSRVFGLHFEVFHFVISHFMRQCYTPISGAAWIEINLTNDLIFPMR